MFNKKSYVYPSPSRQLFCAVIYIKRTRTIVIDILFKSVRGFSPPFLSLSSGSCLLLNNILEFSINR
ncbi:hypothetical protein L1887_28554 [Cichorium endivia]|nr:hypothetical protein L1887_28554 [Cichorium endivia]